MQLEFNVQNQIITRVDDSKPVAKSKKYLFCKFNFCDDWQGITKTAIFTSAGGKVFTVLLKDDSCEVPPEVIEYPHFSVSVFGGDRITANRVSVDVIRSGYTTGETPKPPTPDIYAQILKAISEIQLGEASEKLIQEIVAEKTKVIETDIEGLQNDIKLEAHFRGYLYSNEKIQSLQATPNDFAYSAESGTKWVYDIEFGWQDTGIAVPDQLTPASDAIPLMNGVAAAGESEEYARGDHRHPTDTTRASAEELAKAEKKANKVTKINGLSDDEHYPTAKSVFDFTNKAVKDILPQLDDDGILTLICATLTNEVEYMIFIENHEIVKFASPKYVDNAIGDIETALENIITKYGLGGDTV